MAVLLIAGNALLASAKAVESLAVSAGISAAVGGIAGKAHCRVVYGQLKKH